MHPVLFDGRRAVGVEIIGRPTPVLRARREVIVCGGGILSAKRCCSRVWARAPSCRPWEFRGARFTGVGRHLHDHPAVTLAYHIPGDPNLMGISPTGALALLRAVRRWRKERRGMGATNFGELSGYFCSTDSPRPKSVSFVVAWPWIMVATFIGARHVGRHDPAQAQSRGSVRLD
jgi:choline dehydrogenase-like flavoprotein